MEFQFHTLPNGIRLIHLESASKVAHCGFFFNTGSRDEWPNEHGIAHLIEHLIFKGTTRRKAFHILSRMEDVGGEVNAYTTKEETCIHASFLHEYYDRFLELLSDILFHSTFPDKAIETEKEVVLDEINSYKDSPSEQIYDDFEDQVFMNHPLGRSILGQKDTLPSLTRKQIFEFIATRYNTDHMVLASVGNISFAKLRKLFEKYFADVPARIRTFERAPFRNYMPVNKSVDMNTNQVHVVYGNIAYDLNDERRMILHLLSNILAGPGMISRLNLILRERHGFSYNVESNYSPYTDSGIFAVYFSSDKEYVNKSIALMLKEFDRMRDATMGDIQLKRAKKQIIGQLAISVENLENQMLSIGKSYLVYGKVDTMETIFGKIENITAFQLREVANEILNKETLSSLIFK